jgi:dTDP-4-amino-4,6-dideoxygalactose transaminase
MIPLIKPSPPRLSEAAAKLRQIENSGLFSNFGPVNTQFEDTLVARLFGGTGACLTVCNATIGLMLAVQQVSENRNSRQKYALMPSFTFAAAAQAALWCGLTPLFCDIDPTCWAASAEAEDELLCR